jgi:hypothetical protein
MNGRRRTDHGLGLVETAVDRVQLSDGVAPSTHHPGGYHRLGETW